jgi:hypothetical protein
VNPVSTTILLDHLVNTSQIDSLRVAGRGGKEQDIAKVLLPSAQSVSSPLHDYEILDGETRYHIEVKKQANDQWFDIGKYYNLSGSDRDIVVFFVNHIDGQIQTVAAIKLGTLLDELLSDDSFIPYGWASDVLKIASELKKKCPQLQFKAKLKVRDFVASHRHLFQIFYEGRAI